MRGSSGADAAAASRSVGVIILAAGESRRMGRPKQLLPFAGRSLLHHVCETALATSANPIVVVLGANRETCAAEIADLPVASTYNARWSEGMSGSLREGLVCLTSIAPHAAGVLVMLADQPLIGTAELTALLHEWQPPIWQIAAAAYAGILGAPAVFDRAYFQELMSLSGQEGARAVISRHPAKAASVEMPAAAHDLDTWEEYEQTVSRLADM